MADEALRVNCPNFQNFLVSEGYSQDDVAALSLQGDKIVRVSLSGTAKRKTAKKPAATSGKKKKR